MTAPVRAVARDAAAPLLLLGVLGAVGVVSVNTWVATGTAALISTGSWAAPPLGLQLPFSLASGALPPTATGAVFWTVLATAFGVEAGLTTVATVLVRRSVRHAPLLRARQLGDLAGSAAERKARQLRPALQGSDPVPARDLGIRMLRVGGREVRMSWEDVALVIMGPRANKTSAIAVPAVLSAPGLAIATSNKADLWALTAGMRSQRGPVWTFDPQEIAYHRQTWWWDLLRAIREAPDAARIEAAARLAGHFMQTIGGARRDPFFHAAGEQVLTGTFLAAALSGGTLRDAMSWLQVGRRDAIAALDRAGAGHEAADLEASLSGAEVTTKGIFQTARTATKALTSERILRWITPPETWREPGGTEITELEPWQILATAEHTPTTLHLLSKEGAGTAAPVVAALVDRMLEVAELVAQARGGRVDPPVVAVLDEAANICPIRQLPQLYSHFGSRGLQVMTMLQSYQQGVGVWGAQGMDALWSAATIKLVGAGVDDHTFLQKLSGLIGEHDVEKQSISVNRSGGPSHQYSTIRQPILPASELRALPKTHAVLLATGRPAGLGELLPWYREQDATDINAYAATALRELRTAASAALGPDRYVSSWKEAT
ncbi:type IV secretory system conjugative DNA transfer family protein [Pseudonocardia kunmingensis]|uniref:Type IV secretory pathway TraG/TraD family ATPase VirD4 n=1 Tax=Pseudonocardia kunmingensis TaxID=630975 RepID=A0A543DPA4_9PSEU|nr:type IV secretory system conjugative DNA transfer family protein [Pseudonocardia kunmingensis]TQM11161.1 type IV secretory pathway TraG/TraD family ATPase VirD4 [Pseudonocardia kunmingensis]